MAVVSRRRLLKALESADAPMAVAELAAVVGLHVTTARFHLGVLQRAQLVRRVADPEEGAVRRPAAAVVCRSSRVGARRGP